MIDIYIAGVAKSSLINAYGIMSFKHVHSYYGGKPLYERREA